MSRRAVRRALVSVSDKTGLAELGAALAAAGVEVVSTGSTAAALAAAGVSVTPVEQVTGFPESLDGRVKTLHPAVHAGLLADLRRPEHEAELAGLGYAPFDLLVSNLYPFAATVARPGATVEECVEQIDIGGPAMVRSAAKNHASVAVVVSPAGYPQVARALAAGGFTDDERRELAAAAFAHVADYDIAVAGWFAGTAAPADEAARDGLPAWLGGGWQRTAVLRYGENPHQSAALYAGPDGGGLAGAEQLAGKEMSYNNYTDADAARRAAYDHPQTCVAVIKHANPCGIAIGADVAEAHRKAHACDPLSAFGGVIATNATVTAAMAAQLDGIFTEVIVAPDFEDGALDLLAAKPALRLLRCPAPPPGPAFELKPISGGVLRQRVDAIDAPGDDPATWSLATGDPVDDDVLADLVFAWRSLRAVKSNAILLARDGASVGVGMGQVNRVDASRLAVARAGADRARGAVAASDAFFPFPDGLEVLLEAGVRAVVQPGGSRRDDLCVAAARQAGVPLYLTGTRHFWH